MRILTALILAVPFFAAAQAPQVPHKLLFAGMTLTIRDDAQREIQKDVNALWQSPKHFNIKADRAKTYFPIIEKIFSEEGVPDDFKYLVLQESSLIADAVSTSNAVGFWQFKDFTGIEMGLRVDKQIDERMNISASTRAAARYIKKNNTFFNNWLYALQAYQMGAGGVLNTVKESHSGEMDAEITSRTYWYIKKFLAHKIAFQESVQGKGQVELVIYETKNRKTLSELAKEVNVDEAELRNYNKWTKSGEIPPDRSYSVVIPVVTGLTLPAIPAAVASTQAVEKTNGVPSVMVSMEKAKINGVTAIQALAGETPAKFATRTGVDLASFIKWNEISYSTPLVAGAYYFVGKKRSRAVDDFHKVQKGENLWMVSQKYGVRVSRLKKFNRLQSEVLEPGTTLYLASMKPKSMPQGAAPETNVAEVEEGDTFNWSSVPDEQPKSEPVTSAGAVIVPLTAPVGVALEGEVTAEDSTKVQTDDEVAITTDSASTVPMATPATNIGYHTVQPKETLYAIAKIYNVGVMELVEWNNLDLQQGIKVGQVLKTTDASVPVTETPAPQVSSELLHEVKVSDTLYSIARKYGVTIKDIMEWNEKKDFTLSVGEKIKVKPVR